MKQKKLCCFLLPFTQELLQSGSAIALIDFDLEKKQNIFFVVQQPLAACY